MTVRSVLIGITAGLVAAFLVTAGAAGDGGPSPGVALGWNGVAARDGTVRYVALPTPSGKETAVAAVATRGGRVVRWGGLAGGWGIPMATFGGDAEGLSRDGRRLLLGGLATVRPDTRVTRFALLATKTLRLQRVITLRGAFAYDAMSPDLRTLYLIRYLPGTADVRYEVRAYDLASGRLVPEPIVDRREPDEKMQGSPVARATSADGRWAYTLYSRPGDPFVHALDTVGRRAVCVDLPWKNADEAIFKVRLGLEAAGRRLVLRQGGAGRLAIVDTTTWKVRSFRQPR